MTERNVDVAIIGAGSAGLAAYRAARKWTSSIAIIERGEYGTTCARVGCMPSKLLNAAAEAAHAIGEAAEFGVRSGRAVIDGAAVMDRVCRERDRFVGYVLESVEAIPATDRLVSNARFLDNHRLQFGNHAIINARRIVIATGSSPSYPPLLSGLGDRLVVNDDIFEWRDLPETVAVFGPGVIGLELGQALHRLGVKVLMFGVGGLIGPLTDPEVREAAYGICRRVLSGRRRKGPQRPPCRGRNSHRVYRSGRPANKHGGRFRGRRNGRAEGRAYRPFAGVGASVRDDDRTDAFDAFLPPRYRGRAANGTS